MDLSVVRREGINQQPARMCATRTLDKCCNKCPSNPFSRNEQRPGEEASDVSESHTSRDDLEFALGNVKGEIAFPGDKSPTRRAAAEQEASKACRGVV